MKNLRRLIPTLKAKPAPAAPQDGEVVDHAQFTALNPYDYQIAHKRLVFLFRSSVGLNFILASLVIVSITTIQAMLPLKQIDVALVRADPADNRIFQIEPINQSVPGFQLIQEVIAKKFVQDLLTIDPVTYRERLVKALSYTTPEVGKKIRDEFTAKDSSLNKVLEAGATREIKIIGIDRIYSFYPSQTKFAVDFDQIDRERGIEQPPKHLRIYMTLIASPSSVRENEVYDNPAGIRVSEYAIKYRGDTPKPNQGDNP